SEHQETAVAMQETIVNRIPADELRSRLMKDSLLKDFLSYLASRSAEQQRTIARLLTADTEHRLGESLLWLAERLGQPTAQNSSIKIVISHEELAQTVGASRPRITTFMREFRNLGLIETDPEHYLTVLVNVERLKAHLGLSNC